MKIHGVPAAKFVVSRFLWATKLSSLITFSPDGRYKLRFYPTSVSAMMWCNPAFYEKDEMVLQEWLRPGDVFVDVGANVGILSLAASRFVGGSGRVFSLEAHPRTVKYLRGNVSLNDMKNVTVIHAALGEREGFTTISSLRTDDQNRVGGPGISVPLRTLDSVLPEMRIRLLKIDTEGFELFVLRGAERVLRATDAIFLESWESHFRKYGYSTTDLLALLSTHGFETGLAQNYTSGRCENVLAVRNMTDAVGA
jgi:FkbM family methyltransferase